MLEKELSWRQEHRWLRGDRRTVRPLEQPDCEGDGSRPHCTSMVLKGTHDACRTSPPFPQVLFTHHHQAFSRELTYDAEKAPIWTWKRI